MRRAALAAVAAATLALPVAAQRATVAMDPSPIGSPAGWITADDYPKDAIRAGRQGRVVVTVDVDAAGRATACRIAQSSGTESLDTKTCEIALERGRFNPATDRRGRSIRGTYSLPVRWALPDPDEMVAVDLSTAPTDEAMEIEMGIDPEGRFASCRIITRPASMTSDPCQSMTLGRPSGRRYVKDGKPVAITIHQRFTQSLRASATP